jgi:hypothetical protein
MEERERASEIEKKTSRQRIEESIEKTEERLAKLRQRLSKLDTNQYTKFLRQKIKLDDKGEYRGVKCTFFSKKQECDGENNGTIKLKIRFSFQQIELSVFWTLWTTWGDSGDRDLSFSVKHSGSTIESRGRFPTESEFQSVDHLLNFKKSNFEAFFNFLIDDYESNLFEIFNVW